MNKIISEIKRKHYLKIQRKISTSLFGSEYGGFRIVPKLDSESIVYSFGIGEDLSFSEGIFSSFDCNIYAFDPTPKAIEYVKKHQLYNNHKFHFYPYALGDYDGDAEFHLPTNNDYVSGSMVNWSGVRNDSIQVDVKRLITIMKDLGHTKLDVLKMDIEGSEFKVIEDIVNCNIDIKQICLEVHDRFFDDGIERLKNMIMNMNKINYYLVAKNRGGSCELTFIRL